MCQYKIIKINNEKIIVIVPIFKYINFSIKDRKRT